ncbi:hypothetical protein [Rhodopila sp.]|uniref:hypothetical protein n=1 Tax=Rhodopila sp. TaxID=2480087 RepID=UPI003D0DC1B6
MAGRVPGRFVLPLVALGVAAMLGGCVAYPAYPGYSGYAGYPAYGYGYGYTPYNSGGYIALGGGWHDGGEHEGGWHDGGGHEDGWRR